jgi:hypothetical protein
MPLAEEPFWFQVLLAVAAKTCSAGAVIAIAA